VADVREQASRALLQLSERGFLQDPCNVPDAGFEVL
jgi:hypothetical protein